MPPPPSVKYAEMSIAVVGNAGAGKRGILGTLKYYIQDEMAARNGGAGDHEEKDVGHVLDNGVVRRDMSRRKGTLKGASLPPFGAWRETLCTASEVPPPPSIPHCHRRLKEAESHRRNDSGGDGGEQQQSGDGGGMGLVESGYNTTEDGDIEDDDEYHFKTQQELQEEARAKAKLEVKKRRKRIMGEEEDSNDDDDDNAITSDNNNNDDDGEGKKKKKRRSSVADAASPPTPTTTRYHFPLKITYGIPNALARVTDSELRKHDGIMVVVDASTWDQDKGSFENIFKCFAYECKTWPIIHKVIMLTKCDKVLAGSTLSANTTTSTKKKEKKKDKKGESSHDDDDTTTIIPSTPATVAELHRISLELESLLLETKAMPKRDVVEEEDTNSTSTTKKKGTSVLLPNGAIFECSAETGVNVVRGFHHLAALIRQGRTGPQNTCCVIA